MSEFAVVRACHFLKAGHDGQDDERPIHRVWVDAVELAVYWLTRSAYALFVVVWC